MDIFKKLFHNKSRSTQLFASVSGRLSTIEKLKDEVFSQKMMGDGYFISPVEEICEVACPLEEAIVETIFPTKHAISLRCEGLSLVLHLGIDTVELKGSPFEMLIKEQDKVVKGQPLVKMDVSQILSEGKTPEVIVVFPELERKELVIDEKEQINKEEVVGEVRERK